MLVPRLRCVGEPEAHSNGLIPLVPLHDSQGMVHLITTLLLWHNKLDAWVSMCGMVG